MLKACCRPHIWEPVELATCFELRRGNSPLLVSFPHSGESLGPFGPRMTAAAHQLADTDWHLPRLYSFLEELDATILVANHSRYVIDLNRDPSGVSLYPGQNVTELCPTTTFKDENIYLHGEAPSEDEIKQRLDNYWHPYHSALQSELTRLKTAHGHALLWDAHSIASEVPRFFEGRLPDFNLGNNSGMSCDNRLADALQHTASECEDFSSVLNGRFKGGFITRRYGNPTESIHAVQLELSQITYMNELFPFEYLPEVAAKVARPIRSLLEAMLAYRP
ncbi:MAG: N-formylglutamate deformylase [Kordiimonadales bacterium]|nr:MAG: N-formylglutamate deformylase [Kordiimonadales bacterium]